MTTTEDSDGNERAWHSRAAGDLSAWAQGYRPTSERAARMWATHRDQVEAWVSPARAAGVTEKRRIASAVLELLAWAMPLLDDLTACVTEEVLQQFIRANPNKISSGSLGNIQGRVRRVLKAQTSRAVRSGVSEQEPPARRRATDHRIYDSAAWDLLARAAFNDPVLMHMLSCPGHEPTAEEWAACCGLAREVGVDLTRDRLRRTVQLRVLTALRQPLGRALAELELGRTAATELAALMPPVTNEDRHAFLRAANCPVGSRSRLAVEDATDSTTGDLDHCTRSESGHGPEQPSVPAGACTRSRPMPGGITDVPTATPTTPTTPNNHTQDERSSTDGHRATNGQRAQAVPTPRRRRKPSARQVRLAAAAFRAEAAQRKASFPDEMRSYIREQYRPLPPVDKKWHLLKAAVEATLEASAVRGDDSMRKHVTHLAYFFAWAHSVDLPLGPESLTRPNVATYESEALTSASRSTRQGRRSRLQQMADQIHPEQAPVKGPPMEHRVVAPPYRLAEMAVIRRVARVQPTPELTRQVSLLVGLGAGAGIDSTDLKRLHGRDAVDHGPEIGIEVHVTNLRRSKDNTLHERRRTVWVLREYEDLVRAGLQGVRPNQLLLGRDAERANVAASVYARAALHGDVPELAQSRLRSTWLATHLQRATPLNLLLRAAGLTTARTLVELIAHLPQHDDAKVLR